MALLFAGITSWIIISHSVASAMCGCEFPSALHSTHDGTQIENTLYEFLDCLPSVPATGTDDESLMASPDSEFRLQAPKENIETLENPDISPSLPDSTPTIDTETSAIDDFDGRPQILLGASGGLSNYVDNYLSRANGGGVVLQGALFGGIQFHRLFVEARYYSSSHLSNDFGGLFVSGDRDDFDITKFQVGVGYRLVSKTASITGLYLAVGLTRLQVEERLQDYPPYRQISEVPYQLASSGVRNYLISGSCIGLSPSVSFVKAYQIAENYSLFGGLRTESNIFFSRMRGVEEGYNTFQIVIEFLFGVTFDTR